MNEFRDSVVWIVGASSGFGEALATAFSKAGAKLVLSARREDRLCEVADGLVDARVLPLDLEKPESFPDACREAVAAFGHIDVVVLNAAVAQSGSALETPPAVARRIMEIDYFAQTELTRALLPHMLGRGRGQIVVVSGLLARITLQGRSSYAAAKAALFGWFGCLRAELANSGIDVTILVPGAMRTGLVTHALQPDGSPKGGAAPDSGCPVGEAARQALAAIARRAYEAYLGDEQGERMWALSLQAPEKAIETILGQVRQAS